MIVSEGIKLAWAYRKIVLIYLSTSPLHRYISFCTKVQSIG